MGSYHACHIATNGMMARLGNMLGGHQGRLFNIGMVMAGISAGTGIMMGGANYPTISQKQHKVIKT
ncbi:hypothetical protein C0150_08440 [Moraxella catarrhalis]|uniref:hypothetical protein n=1 Tax=Moraxella catarrhalis TaxID=480 RepID=UPI00128C1786|nr:hypothetical protein [Moraxella catarrhalis]MPX72265.1 hypothetical protein [Moraxella catarrhalis]